MPTFRHGKLSYFSLGSLNTESNRVNLSPYLSQVQFPRPIDVAETSTFGTTAKQFVVGLTSASFSFSGHYDETIVAQLEGLVGSERPVAFGYGPGGSAAGRKQYLGICLLTSLDSSGSITDMTGLSLSAQVTGSIGSTVMASSSTAILPTLAQATITSVVDVSALNGSANIICTSGALAAGAGAFTVLTANGAAVIGYTSSTATLISGCTLLSGSGSTLASAIAYQ